MLQERIVEVCWKDKDINKIARENLERHCTILVDLMKQRKRKLVEHFCSSL